MHNINGGSSYQGIKRFKTKQELIEDFGDGWKFREYTCDYDGGSSYRACWHYTLDDMLGKEITSDNYIEWSISEDWLTDKPLPIKTKTGNNIKDKMFVIEVDNEVMIKLLPSPDMGTNIAMKYTHTIKVNNRWIVEQCPTTQNDGCPVCDAYYKNKNTKLKNCTTGYVNAYIIDDKKCPENNGKVFIVPLNPMFIKRIQAYGTNCISANNFVTLTLISHKDRRLINYNDSFIENNKGHVDGFGEIQTHILYKIYGKYKSYDELKKIFSEFVDFEEEEDIVVQSNNNKVNDDFFNELKMERMSDEDFFDTLKGETIDIVDSKVSDLEENIVCRLDEYLELKLDERKKLKTNNTGGKKMETTDFKNNVMDISKRVWAKNATLNTEAAKSAAKLKIGSIVNNKLVNVVLNNIGMPKWLSMFGGKKVLRPIIKILISNLGVVSMAFFESQGYKSTKAEYVSEAMMFDGYSTATELINTDNISSVVDKIIGSIPDKLFTEAGFTDNEEN